MLVDTHILLWLASGQLPSQYHSVLSESPSLLFSHASLWEIAIKVSIGKLESYFLSAPQVWAEAGLKELPIDPNHIIATTHLPFHHRDPFDRLLIAQAQAESVAFLTRDIALGAYGYPVRVIR